MTWRLHHLFIFLGVLKQLTNIIIIPMSGFGNTGKVVKS